jgi:hypothetical protein
VTDSDTPRVISTGTLHPPPCYFAAYPPQKLFPSLKKSCRCFIGDTCTCQVLRSQQHGGRPLDPGMGNFSCRTIIRRMR